MRLYCSICSSIEFQGITGCNWFNFLDNNIGIFMGGRSLVFGELH
jgi:hypothetical protein